MYFYVRFSHTLSYAAIAPETEKPQSERPMEAENCGKSESVFGYSPSEVGVTAEMLTNCVPFLTNGLCNNCTHTISKRVRSLDSGEDESILESIKYAKSDGADRLSNLPIEILVRILSFIDTAEVVRTCVLSRSWKSIWKSVPTLIFKEEIYFDGEWWKNFVQRLLTLHDSPHIYKLFFTSLFIDDSLFETSIRFAIQHNLQHLHLSFLSHHKTWELPPYIFTCASLQVLKIENARTQCPLVRLPSIVTLDNLHTLYLMNVKITDETFNNFVSVYCPLLKNITLRSCRGLYHLNITSQSLQSLDIKLCYYKMVTLSAPNLQILKWEDHIAKDFIFDDSNSLSKVCCMFAGFRKEDNNIFSLIKFLRVLHNVRTLIIDLSSIKYENDGLLTLSGKNDLGISLPTLLPNVSYLKAYSGFNKYEIPLNVFLLKNAPLLHSLFFEEHCTRFYEDLDFEAKKRWDYLQENIHFFNHLEVCHVQFQKKTKDVSLFLDYIRGHAPSLKKMVLKPLS